MGGVKHVPWITNNTTSYREEICVLGAVILTITTLFCSYRIGLERLTTSIVVLFISYKVSLSTGQVITAHSIIKCHTAVTTSSTSTPH